MCGEHLNSIAATLKQSGSSPHVRGTQWKPCAKPPHYGIIPACAGNTWRARRRWCRHRDHPRMCGEHLTVVPSPGNAPGSSPHVRGTRRIILVNENIAGIIPACAGNTIHIVSSAHASGDHPRMCGEHLFKDW